MSDLQVAAIIPAAGSGRRMNTGVNKIWLPLCGRAMISHTLSVFYQSKRVSKIVLVVNEEEKDLFTPIIHENNQNSNQDISLVVGGSERQVSVMNGLNFLT
jgi:2-C-methyl-D-erythritol 4-phosphate cytidylyltransferase